MTFLNIWKETTLAALIVAVVTGIIAFSICKSRNKKIYYAGCGVRAMLWALFFAYLVFVIAITLLPLPSFHGPMNISIWRKNLVLEPIAPIIRSARTAKEYLSYNEWSPLYLFLYNTIGNLILLMPFVLFFRLLVTDRYTIIFLWSLCFSVLIESTQGLLCYLSGVAYRVVDINDFILNVTGASFMLLLTGLVDSFIHLTNRIFKK